MFDAQHERRLVVEVRKRSCNHRTSIIIYANVAASVILARRDSRL